MSCPVIRSNGSLLPEVEGDATEMVDPLDEESGEARQRADCQFGSVVQ